MHTGILHLHLSVDQNSGVVQIGQGSLREQSISRTEVEGQLTDDLRTLHVNALLAR